LVIAFGYAKLDFGEVFKPEDIFGREPTEVFERALALGLAVSPAPGVGVGVSLEHVHSGFGDDASAVSVSAGAGYAPRIPVELHIVPGASSYVSPLAGLSLLHFGSDLEYSEDVEPAELARRLHAAIGARFVHEPPPSRRVFDSARFAQFEIAVGVEVSKEITGAAFFDWEGLDGGVVTYSGIELRALGILSLRRGRIDDVDGISGDTWGYGIGLEGLLPVGIRYDYAEFPQVSRFGLVQRRAVVLELAPWLFGGSAASGGGR
jgi:hypothetical protein